MDYDKVTKELIKFLGLDVILTATEDDLINKQGAEQLAEALTKLTIISDFLAQASPKIMRAFQEKEAFKLVEPLIAEYSIHLVLSLMQESIRIAEVGNSDKSEN
jgi:hypothetical protein